MLRWAAALPGRRDAAIGGHIRSCPACTAALAAVSARPAEPEWHAPRRRALAALAAFAAVALLVLGVRLLSPESGEREVDGAAAAGASEELFPIDRFASRDVTFAWVYSLSAEEIRERLDTGALPGHFCEAAFKRLREEPLLPFHWMAVFVAAANLEWFSEGGPLAANAAAARAWLDDIGRAAVLDHLDALSDEELDPHGISRESLLDGFHQNLVRTGPGAEDLTWGDQDLAPGKELVRLFPYDDLVAVFGTPDGLEIPLTPVPDGELFRYAIGPERLASPGAIVRLRRTTDGRIVASYRVVDPEDGDDG